MVNDKKDLRTIKTKRAIDAAFTKLIQEKGFEAMTIKDIAEEAVINRGTFYKHYLDKYDLLESYENALLQGVAEILTRNIEEKQNPLSMGMPKKIATQMFEYVDENADKIITLFNNHGGNQFEHKVRTYMYDYYQTHSYMLVDETKLRVDRSYLIAYITNAHVGLMRTWLETGRKESSEALADILEILTVKGPFYAAGLID
ncbi:TetR/AcrR family transcriptional regulator [Salinicoccus hispanicus]|uniref:TetR family transcriptional regulator n=1 Tax=Salinicoccus hispanicus TaxID=157225 RepID=A0A6N8U017_9STAP|nr:TetR/AcrR family transcriptional regulator [Salinicoccus hispanicus]MXQ51082.1 TetR family transcriptional regulator [Salinicoccus hispanicus]